MRRSRIVCAKSKNKDCYETFMVKITNANLQDPLLGYDTAFPNWKDYSNSELSPH